MTAASLQPDAGSHRHRPGDQGQDRAPAPVRVAQGDGRRPNPLSFLPPAAIRRQPPITHQPPPARRPQIPPPQSGCTGRPRRGSNTCGGDGAIDDHPGASAVRCGLGDGHAVRRAGSWKAVTRRAGRERPHSRAAQRSCQDWSCTCHRNTRPEPTDHQRRSDGHSVFSVSPNKAAVEAVRWRRRIPRGAAAIGQDHRAVLQPPR